MLAEPADQRSGRRVFEQVDDSASISIDQNRPATTSAAESELIYYEEWFTRSGLPNARNSRHAAPLFASR